MKNTIIIVVTVILFASAATNAILYWRSSLSEEIIQSHLVTVQILESLLKERPQDLSMNEVLTRIQTLFPDADIKAENDSIVFANTRLYFRDDTYWGSSYEP